MNVHYFPTLTYPRSVLDNNKKLKTKKISRQKLGKTFKYSKLALNFPKYANSWRNTYLGFFFTLRKNISKRKTKNFKVFEIKKMVST